MHRTRRMLVWEWFPLVLCNILEIILPTWNLPTLKIDLCCTNLPWLLLYMMKKVQSMMIVELYPCISPSASIQYDVPSHCPSIVQEEYHTHHQSSRTNEIWHSSCWKFSAHLETTLPLFCSSKYSNTHSSLSNNNFRLNQIIIHSQAECFYYFYETFHKYYEFLLTRCISIAFV